MKPASQSLITELDATLRKIPDARQLVILRRVTDLFLVGDLPPLKWSSLRYGFDHGG